MYYYFILKIYLYDIISRVVAKLQLIFVLIFLN